ncbi:hypothetical protein GM661_12350 [Iocasia frigidifontis]|uniref:Uncharacterized protein n=2 Tax=Iocasia fonsfrigidae TaxID=2682810 RepID=A0A8A7KGR7_9FIRM|nr:hypothetical protein GM661_12350 [Iocasia fonsfrigidae]
MDGNFFVLLFLIGYNSNRQKQIKYNIILSYTDYINKRRVIMGIRRMAYRLPEIKYNKVEEKLAEQGIEFDEFLDRTIELYLNEKLDPKLDSEGWGRWMEENN